MDIQKKKSFSRREFLKVLAGTAGALAATSLLNACAPATKAPEGAAATAVPAAEAVTIRLWTFNDPGWLKASDDLIKKWAEQNSKIVVKHENFAYDVLLSTIQTSMAAKNEADIIEMFGSWVQSYAKGNTIAPVPEGVMTLADAQKLFFKAPLDGFVWQGKLYGLPHEYNLENGGVLVNKRMFDEARVKYPPAWTSWDEVIADAKKLTKFDGTTMTQAGLHWLNADGFAFWLWEGILERGADYFAADKIHLNLTSPQALDNVQWMVDLCLKHKVVDANTFNPTIADVQDSFFQGLCAIGFRGPWVVPGGRVNYPKFTDPWDYVSIPPLFGSQYNFAADSGWGEVVSPNSKNQDAAWQFIKYTAGIKEQSRIWNVNTGTAPSMQEVAADPTLLTDLNWLGPSLKVLPYGRFVGDLQDRDFIWYNVVRDTIVTACQGNLSVKDACAKMEKDSNDKIDSKLKGG